MSGSPESLFVLTIEGDRILNKRPDGDIEQIALSELSRVLVETNDSGPWFADVWFILEGGSPDRRVCFPMGATGESVIIERLAKLPGFEMRGMNSTQNALFECWPNPMKPMELVH